MILFCFSSLWITKYSELNILLVLLIISKYSTHNKHVSNNVIVSKKQQKEEGPKQISPKLVGRDPGLADPGS